MKSETNFDSPFLPGKVTPRTPFERIDYIRYLVEQEDDFHPQIAELCTECDSLRLSENEAEWKVCRDFLSLLDDYVRALADGSATAASLRCKIAAFRPEDALVNED